MEYGKTPEYVDGVDQPMEAHQVATKPASHRRKTAPRRLFAWAIAQKSGTKAIQAQETKSVRGRERLVKIADEKMLK